MNPPPRKYDDSLLPAAARLVVPLQCMFSIYLLLRGHNLPGGGFIGGLVLASALVLRQMVRPPKRTVIDPVGLVGVGMLFAVTSAMIPLLMGREFFQAIWLGDLQLPVLGKIKIGTPLLFDIGVFLAVTGVGTKILSVLLSQNQSARRN